MSDGANDEGGDGGATDAEDAGGAGSGGADDDVEDVGAREADAARDVGVDIADDGGNESGAETEDDAGGTECSAGDCCVFDDADADGMKGCAQELRRCFALRICLRDDLRSAEFISSSVFAGVTGNERGESGG